MKNVLFSLLAYAGLKSAALDGACADVQVASVRVILHGDADLFQRTASELASNGGETKAGELSKSHKGDVLGRLRAAHAAALAQSQSIRPVRKGKPNAEETAQAQAAASTIAQGFRDACQADQTERTEAAQARAAKAKDSKAATTPAPAAPASDEVTALAVAIAQRDAAQGELAAVTAELEAVRAMLQAVADCANIKAVRALLAA